MAKFFKMHKTYMIKKIFFIGLAFGSIAHYAQADEGFVIDYFNKLESLQADFTQSSEPVDKTKNSSGELFLKKGKGFRFDYLKPFKQEVVSNLTKAWVYDKDLEQVTERKINTKGAESPMQFLVSSKPVNESFKIKVIQDKAEYLLFPKAEQKDVDIDSIQISFKDNQLSKIDVIDSASHKTRFTLSKLKENISIDDMKFNFVVPTGVDVIKE